MISRLFTLIFCCFLVTKVAAQDRFNVQRCADIDRRVPIKNIYIDEKKNKWVADGQGLFLAQSPAFAQTADVPRDQWSLLSVKNGNKEISFEKAELKNMMGEAFNGITTAQMDVRKNELWIGTKNNGLFHFKTTPGLSLIGNITSDNSKLRSDRIQTIHIASSGELLIGTDDGLLQKRGSKEELIGKFFNVEDALIHNGSLWLVGDGEVLEVEGRKEVYSFSVKPGMTEGDVVDIEFDSKGNMWIASEVVCRYNFETEEFSVFGPADGFTSQYVEYISIDSDDAAWVGTKDKGVYFIGSASTMGATIIVEKKLGCDADAKDAAFAVRATGGEPPYQYKWTGGLSGAKPTGIGPGTYKVTVTDSEGQTIESETTLDDPRIAVNVLLQKEATNGGNADGVAEVKATGGGGFYNYKWDNGESEAVAKKLKAGKHVVSITDKNGCTVTGEIEMKEGLAALVIELEQTEKIKCPGEAQAALKANVTGGQAPYKFTWSDKEIISETATGLKAGEYQVTITDAVGNTANNTFTIEEPRPLQVKVTADAPATANNEDGQASVRSQGGTGALSFKWDNGETSDTPEKLSGGSHTVTVTDEAGCSTTATVEISEDILPLAVELAITTEVKCAGDNNAALAASVKGGKSPFEYAWSAADASGETADNLAAGDYEVTITDAAGNTASAKYTIEDASGLTATVKVEQPASTNNEDGKARANVEGGSGNYVYRWDTGETNVTAEKLAGGQHTITILDTKECSTTIDFEVSEDILPLAVELKVNSQVNCNGEAGAAISVEVSGGKGPFNYNWSAPEVTGELIENQKAGTYVITVTDAAGNETTAEINVEEPDELVANITPTSPASTGNADGKARVKVDGGGGKYTYKWDSGETTVEAEQLAAGEHIVTVTDANGCSTTATVEIGEDILPLAVAMNLSSPINCAGENNASINVDITGGKGPFEYRWSSGGANGELADNLTAGDYQVTVVDATGAEATAEINIPEPNSITANITPTSPASTDQSDGKALVKVEGGSGKFTYNWDNGETTANAGQLSAGNHSVTVSDENGCSTVANLEVSEDILPLAVEMDLTSAISCAGENNAVVTAQVSGGKGPFLYKWSIDGARNERAENLKAGIYKVTITDAVGTKTNSEIEVPEPDALTASISPTAPASTGNADGEAIIKVNGGTGEYVYRWDSGETSAEAKQLVPGNHNATITDAAGCSVTAEIEISEDILPLEVNLVATSPINCAGEVDAVLEAEVSGGKKPFNYAWSTGSTADVSISNVAPGTYEVTVTDAVGSSQVGSLLIKAPEALSLKVTQSSPASASGSDGQATATVKGGSGDYNYKWDTGETTAEASRLALGKHEVTISDSKGCTIIGDVEIDENILPLNVTLTETEKITCNGGTAGLNIEVEGGKAPYDFQWNNPDIKGEAPEKVLPGNYMLTVSDASGQSKSAKIEITEPSELTAELTKMRPASNESKADGRATLIAKGGGRGYRYRWDNGETAATAKELGIGVHSVAVTDAFGCELAINFTIEKRVLPKLTAASLRAGQIIQMSRLYFGADSSYIKPESYAVVNEVADFLDDNPFAVIEVRGHTNNLPPHDYCDSLSTLRAKVVADYITSKGIDKTRVFYKGYGKRKQRWTNKTADGRAKNQRVEVKIVRLREERD